MPKRKTHEEYVNELAIKNPNIEQILEEDDKIRKETIKLIDKMRG